MSTLRITNIEAKADASSPSVDEKVKILNSDGDTLLQIDGATSGVSTVTVGTGVTIQGDTGIITATKFSGSVSGDVTGNLSGDIIGTRTLGTGVTVTSAGIVSATQYYGSGQQLTSIPGAQITGTIPAGSLTEVDLATIRKDVAHVALIAADANNKIKTNLANSLIDAFEDSSGIDSGNTTDVTRNTSGAYISSVGSIPCGGPDDPYSELLIPFREADDFSGVAFKEESRHNRTITQGGNATGLDWTHVPYNSSVVWYNQSPISGQDKVRSMQCRHTSFSVPDSATLDPGTKDWSFSVWIGNNGYQQDQVIFSDSNNYWMEFMLRSDYKIQTRISSNCTSWDVCNNTGAKVLTPGANGSAPHDNGDFYHCYWQRKGTNISMYIDGDRDFSLTVAADMSIADRGGNKVIGPFGKNTGSYNYLDEIHFRIGKTDYDASGTGVQFTAYNRQYPVTAGQGNAVDGDVFKSVKATGTTQSTANTASSTVSKISGVLLYEDAKGTNTLGTDLKVYFSANGGTNWTEVGSSDFGTASNYTSTIKKVDLAEKTISNTGTDIRWKMAWANQSDTKEVRVHGIALNY